MNNNPTITPQVVNSPFKNFCMSVGAIPTSYQDSLDYYETLLWLIKFLDETVIPAVSTNGNAVAELQNFYLQLQSYVNNYFDNLDVQEEINNKLDDMVEQGTLQEIIADYLNSKAIFGFDTVADMKSATYLINGSYAKTYGYYSANDGGQGEYIIVDDNTLLDDGGSIHTLNNGLRAKLINNGEYINVNQFGCLSNGITDNRTNIQNAVDYAIANKLNIHFNSGIYGLSGTINFPLNQNGIIIKGVSKWRTTIQALDNNTQFNFKDFLRSKIEDIRFIGTGDEEIPLIKIEGVAHLSELNNCIFNTNMGLYCESSAYFSLNNCSFVKVVGKHCNYLISIKGEYFYSNNSYYEANNDTSSNNDIGVIINEGQNIFFTNSDICNWSKGIGLLLNVTNGTIKNVYIKNTTFVRNKINIDCYCNNSITNVNLEDNDFIVTEVVDKIIDVHRDSGKTGTLNNLNGIINLDGSTANWDFSKEIFSTNTSCNGSLKVKSVKSQIPDYNVNVPIIPVLSINKNLTINGSNSNFVKVVLSNKSPFKDNNLPEFECVKYNGRAWTNYTISNTFQGELSITFNYNNTYESLYTQAYLKIKYFD